MYIIESIEGLAMETVPFESFAHEIENFGTTVTS
jgi:hypothetical protein